MTQGDLPMKLVARIGMLLAALPLAVQAAPSCLQRS
ncbi:hypothetical protein HNQ86_000241 [Oleiagrimonas soli]|uniref:Uncharacterized protein n=1 Tax=Oleiagrimonas soli TaxID=1543381 RepID=A0A841KCL1_9GAMM|nr:hypothetical protein [Oleiagrimonas soli]